MAQQALRPHREEESHVRYQWRHGLRMVIPAQAAGERIEQLSSSLGRALQRSDILADARLDDSPFNAEVFREGDGEAANKWRLEVCGRILRGIEMVNVSYQEGGDITISVAQPVVTHVATVGYELTAKVMTDMELRQIALATIVQQLRSYRAKLQRYETIARLMDGVISAAESMGAQ